MAAPPFTRTSSSVGYKERAHGRRDPGDKKSSAAMR
jgi:hypothetical protein